MARKRDYKAEYAERIARGRQRGLSRSQSRGHPKADERATRATAAPADEKVNLAIRLMHGGASLSAAARTVHASPERLRRYIKGNGIAHREGSAWVMTDERPRRVPIIERSRAKPIIVPNFGEASKAGRYHNAIRRFVNSGDIDELSPFDGDGLTDIRGKFHPFETDPNALYRYAAKDEPAFHEIYQIVAL